MKRTSLARLLLVVLAALSLFAVFESAGERALRAACRERLRLSLEDVDYRIRTTSADLKTLVDSAQKVAISRARALARIVAADPSILSDTNRFERTRVELDVDEIHVSDARGILVASVPASYRGYDMARAPQSAAFLPALTNRAFALAQEPMPKGIDKQLFQYAGVARQDSPGIVQVGSSAKNFEKARDLADVEGIARSARAGRGGFVTVTPLDRRNRGAATGYFTQVTGGVRMLCLAARCDEWRVTLGLPDPGTWLAHGAAFAAACFTALFFFLLLLGVILPGFFRVSLLHLHALEVLFGKDMDGPVPVQAPGKPRVRKTLLNPIVLVCAGAFLFASALAWVIQAANVENRSREVLLSMVDGAVEDVSESVDNMLFAIGKAICRHYRRPDVLKPSDAKDLLHRYDIDEINVCDGRGIVVATILADLGYDMGSKPTTAEFNCLLHGQTTFVQKFRSAVENPDIVRKYAGVAFPDAPGYVQLGLDQKRFKDDLRYLFENAVRDHRIGETGFFFCTEDRSGRIVANGAPKAAPSDTLAGIGYDGVTAPGPGVVFEAPLYGARSLVVWKPYADHRIYAVLPFAEISAGRTILATLAILLVIFVAFAFFATRLTTLVSRLKDFIAAEKNRLESDMKMANTIQMSSLPVVFPDQPEFRIFARMDPAREVGGDFYDFYGTPDGRLVFLIADVSGKGVPAAMFMMKAKAILRAAVFESPDLAAAVKAANDRLAAENEAEMFVTAWIGALDPKTGCVEYVNAGHNPPVLRRAAGTVEWIKGRRGLFLAGSSESRYTVQELQLAQGDTLLLYTDGVTEAVNPQLELYGEARLEAAFAAAPSGRYVSAIRDDVNRFAAGADPADDLTMVALDFFGGVSQVFPAAPGGLGEATDFLAAQLESLECPPAVSTKFMIAFDEIGSNVMRYSGSPDFSVSINRRAGRWSVSISDTGAPYDPLANADPDVTLAAEDRPIGGLGIFMTKKLMDDVRYERTNGRNRLTLIKNESETKAT